MNHQELLSLPDIVRLPYEVLRDRLTELKFPPAGIALSPDGGLGVFFEAPKGDLKITADIEIDPDGSVTASVIPYTLGPDGHDVYNGQDEPIDLWDVEEEPPFEETLVHIRFRLGIEIPSE